MTKERTNMLPKFTDAQQNLIADSALAQEHSIEFKGGEVIPANERFFWAELAHYAETRREACSCSGMGMDGAREARSWEAIRKKASVYAHMEEVFWRENV